MVGFAAYGSSSRMVARRAYAGPAKRRPLGEAYEEPWDSSCMERD